MGKVMAPLVLVLLLVALERLGRGAAVGDFCGGGVAGEGEDIRAGRVA